MENKTKRDWDKVGEIIAGLLALILVVGGGVTIVVAIWMWDYPLSLQLAISAVLAIFVGATIAELNH